MTNQAHHDMTDPERFPGMTKERFHRSGGSAESIELRPVFTDFHRLAMTADFEYPRHQHANHELILVEDGPYRCELNGSELEVASGDGLLIKPGDWHQDHLRAGQFHYVVHFAFGMSGPVPQPGIALYRPGVAPEEQVASGAHAVEAGLLGQIEQESQTGSPYSSRVQDGLLQALFWRTVRGLPESALSARFRRFGAAQVFLQRLRALFDERIGDSLPVSEMAAELGISRRGLTVKCREALGESPASAFLQHRLAAARDRLRFTEEPIKAISYDLGFKSPYHFSRVFRHEVGMPPSIYREEG